MPRILTSTLRSRSILLSSMLFILSLLLLSHLVSARNPEAGSNTEANHTGNLLSSSDDPQANKPHLLAGSYYSMRGGLSATLMLNNKGPLPLEVQPTLFSLAGERLAIAPVTVEGNSFSMIDLSEWAALGGEAFKEGSVQLFHRGRDLVLGAQIYLVDAEHSLSFDEKLNQNIKHWDRCHSNDPRASHAHETKRLEFSSCHFVDRSLILCQSLVFRFSRDWDFWFDATGRHLVDALAQKRG